MYSIIIQLKHTDIQYFKLLLPHMEWICQFTLFHMLRLGHPNLMHRTRVEQFSSDSGVCLKYPMHFGHHVPFIRGHWNNKWDNNYYHSKCTTLSNKCISAQFVFKTPYHWSNFSSKIVVMLKNNGINMQSPYITAPTSYHNLLLPQSPSHLTKYLYSQTPLQRINTIQAPASVGPVALYFFYRVYTFLTVWISLVQQKSINPAFL